ncbi:hypothetical protein L484_024130 [Morus notabilis]|uniref:Uncharacterized protein n=1 Tax=Morus notabilis TaxID=981085 RepID=W9RV10_9ROSA|nr:hypothetical protein L484_024130 [Morus notabilis]
MEFARAAYGMSYEMGRHVSALLGEEMRNRGTRRTRKKLADSMDTWRAFVGKCELVAGVT